MNAGNSALTHKLVCVRQLSYSPLINSQVSKTILLLRTLESLHLRAWCVTSLVEVFSWEDNMHEAKTKQTSMKHCDYLEQDVTVWKTILLIQILLSWR